MYVFDWAGSEVKPVSDVLPLFSASQELEGY